MKTIFDMKTIFNMKTNFASKFKIDKVLFLWPLWLFRLKVKITIMQIYFLHKNYILHYMNILFYSSKL